MRGVVGGKGGKRGKKRGGRGRMGANYDYGIRSGTSPAPAPLQHGVPTPHKELSWRGEKREYKSLLALCQATEVNCQPLVIAGGT